MAKKKVQQEKPKLVNTKPKIVRGKVIEPAKNPVPVPSMDKDRDNVNRLPGGRDVEDKVTDLQWRFVNEYFRDFNATQAARRAGYSDPNWGRQLLSNPSVAALVKQYKAEMKEKYQIEQEWLIERFIENHARALQVEPVYGPDGEPTGEYKYDGGVANTALANIGKITGHMKDRTEMTGKDGKAIEMNLKVEGQISLTLSDLGNLSLPARKEVLAMLEAKENGNGNHVG